MGRPDGKVVKNLPEYRRMMPYFLRHKYESLYYWDYDFDTEKSDDFLERMSEEYGMRVTYFHLVLHSLMKTYVKYPRVNRFVKAGKIFQRDRIWFSFSIKKEMSTEAKVSIVKREFKPDFTLKDTVKAAKKDTKMGKAGKGDKGEKEAKNYLRFPGPIIRLGYPFYKFMDEHGLFTRKYMEHEVLYSSAFVNNVGTFGANPAYHHLYEIGTIGVFIVVGAFVDKVVPEDGKPVIKRICPFKVTVDERSEDGFYFFKAFEYFRHQLENPEKLLEPAEQGK
jgi:hypothetical protein